MTTIPTGFAEVSIRWGIPGTAGPAFTVYGVEAVTPTTASDIATAVSLAWQDGPDFVQTYIDSSITCEQIRVVFESVAGPVFAELPQGWTGGEVGTSSSPQVTYLVKKVSGQVGRSKAGRMYLPGVPNDVVDEGGLLTSLFRLGLQDAMDDLLENHDTAGIPMVVLHADALEAPTVIQSLNVDPKVATQRRRLR